MWNDARSINLLANAIYVTAATLLGIAAVIWLAHRPVFALQAIWVEGDQGRLEHLSAESVSEVITGRQVGNFFTANLQDVREMFEGVPWVRQASVRRQWPNALVVTVQEHQALGLWNETRLMNSYGESFTANLGEAEDEQRLPVMGGPPGSEKLVAQRYAELVDWFRPSQLYPSRVWLTSRYAWEVTLSNGTTLELGRDPTTLSSTSQQHGLEDRVQRFIKALPVIQANIGTVQHADLRYSNGFAVKTVNLSDGAGGASAVSGRSGSDKQPTQKKP